VISIGQGSTDLGIIQSANATALRLFGYTRRDLIGRNIDVLVPEPLATVHQSFMLKYIQTGRETVMNTTRTVFGRHHDGHIFPILLNVKPLETSFAGVIAELHTSEHFILFASKSFVVSAASLESMTLLGVRCASIVLIVLTVLAVLIVSFYSHVLYMWAQFRYLCVHICNASC
jgi:PAS domain S-box-containing protein